ETATPVDMSTLGLSRWLLARFGAAAFIPRQDLHLLGRSVESYLVRKATLPLAGLLLPALAGTALATAGIHLPLLSYPIAGVATAAVLFVAVDLDVRGRAEDARAEARHYVMAYLNLVALNRAASLGPVESLQRAAEMDNWVFRRIRDAVLEAQLGAEAPWQRLRRLGEEIGVRELSEVGDITAVAGESGGEIYQALRARHHGLATALLSADEVKANA